MTGRGRIAQLVDRIVANIVRLQIQVVGVSGAFAAHTDPEALHDLRTTVRRLRNLLRPLRGLPGVVQLEMLSAGGRLDHAVT